MEDLVDAAKKADFTDIIVVNETRGNPDNLIISHLPYGPTAYFTLSNCILRHDIPECTPASQAYPHLILDGLESKIGKRFSTIIQSLYPPLDSRKASDTKRIITYSANSSDYISFRHHMYSKDYNNGTDSIVLKECGPRFEMQPYEVRLGTLSQDTDTAEKEWVLRPYMNTARKSQTL